MAIQLQQICDVDSGILTALVPFQSYLRGKLNQLVWFSAARWWAIGFVRLNFA